jgi:hypothetical protein
LVVLARPIVRVVADAAVRRVNWRTRARLARTLRRWAADEREAWLAAVQSDPLLPERLLPAEYLGRRAWERRKAVLCRTGQRLRTFAP